MERMTPLLQSFCILFICGKIDPILSLADQETVLPCRYQPDAGVQVVQVTWYKEHSDGTKEQIITAHQTNGQTAFDTWSRRVHFRNSDPIVDSSLVIMNTDVADEGGYLCRISTFPLGNFDRQMSIIVWTIPISSLEPVTLVEGQTYRQAAYCRSVAHPLPRLSWDTDLNGQSTNRSSGKGVVTSQYSLHPLRNMNGMKLDCLVWHPTLEKPRRLSNKLVVHFPPDLKVLGSDKTWFVGLENAAVTCVSGGNPKPRTTWIRVGAELPEGVTPYPNGTLAFRRPLSSSDEGTYRCVAKNDVGEASAEVEIKLTESAKVHITENMLMIIVGSVAGGLLILMVAAIIIVTCHHKRKNKRLEKELTEKNEEISTLSRHASFRRMNSVSTDPRGATEENIPLRVEETLRTSFSSLGEQGQYRDSRSTISGGRGGGAFDYLGRPVLHNNSRRSRQRHMDIDEENQLRVETFVRDSTMSLQESRFRPPLVPSPLPILHSPEILKHLNGSAIVPGDADLQEGSATKAGQHPPLNCGYPPAMDDEDEVDEGLGGPASQENPDDQDSETNSSHVSEACSMRHYQQTNGTLRPKILPKPSGISPHASTIHKAQIV
ncbi:hypothetical protein fugu_001674 [Takifugu bimaculatus]|uniref:Ig-like domain-containing protein n=1 Tax=Takifugu bimaculatus TaxID=433685 RepID=A0A4Z2BP78_9TELE|nr:hypothetical protein fugu_001674 [Takifugu bimaculatus]